MLKKTACLTLFLTLLIPTARAAGRAENMEDITLTLLWFNTSNELEVLEDVIADYLQERPNITLDVQLVSIQDYEQRLRLMIDGGTPPDLVRLTNQHLPGFMNELQPLNRKIDSFNSYISGFTEQALAFATHPDGSLLAVPTETTVASMLVNVDLYQNAGIDVRELSRAWTWDDWYNSMLAVMEANSGLDHALAFDDSPHRWSALLFAAGGRFLNETGTAMDFLGPEALDALNFFKRIHDDGLVPPSLWLGSGNPRELFQGGQVASHIGGSWLINAYADAIKDFEWAAVRLPRRKIRSSVAGGNFIATFKNSLNQKEAIDLMLHFSDHNATYCRDTLNLSPRTDQNIRYPSRSEDLATMVTDLEATPTINTEDWKSPVLNTIYSYIREQIVEGLLGNITMDDVAQNIQNEGNKFFPDRE